MSDHKADVARTALELLDEWGPTSVTIELVATQSGHPPEKVCEIVATDDQLLDLACDQIYSEVDLRQLDVPWPERLRQYSRSFRSVLLRHPRAAPTMAVRPIVSEASMALAEQALSQLTSVGFDAKEANRVLLVIVSFVNGHVLTEIGYHPEFGGHGEEDLRRFRQGLPTDSLPLTASALSSDPDRDAEFELGLRLLTDGLERRLLHAAP